MKIKKFIKEAKELNFQKKRDKMTIPSLKENHNLLQDIIEDLQKQFVQEEETETILFLLISARKQLKKYIDNKEQ